MHFQKWILPFFFLSFLTISSFADTSSTQTHFPLTLQLGNQQWALGNHQDDNNLEMAEYVTGTEDVNNWTQLVTFQLFKFAINKDVTPAAFADKEVTPLKNQGYKISYNIIESSPQEALMEFRVEEPKAEQQDEIQRIIKTPDDRLIVLHYVIKKFDMGQAERSKWINILKTLNMPFLGTTVNQMMPVTPVNPSMPVNQAAPANQAIPINQTAPTTPVNQ